MATILNPSNGGQIGRYFNVKGLVVASTSTKPDCIDIQLIGGDMLYNDVNFSSFEISGGGDFSDRDELLLYIQNNFFKPASGGGGSQNLQQVTDGEGNSVTTNPVIFKDFEGGDNNLRFETNADSSILEANINGIITAFYFQDGTDGNAAKLQSQAEVIAQFFSPGAASGLAVDFYGRISAQDPIDGNNVVNLGYLQNRSNGGFDTFTADGLAASIDILHNLNIDNGDPEDPDRYRPKYFTLTTTTPVLASHEARTVEFPDPVTMRITFTSAPIVGEDAVFCWSVHR